LLNSTDELDKTNIKYDLVIIPEDVHTVEDVQKACNCTKQVVIKSLLFVGHEPVMVLMPGDKQVDLIKLKELVNDPALKMAKPEEVIKLTGYKVGTVSPFGLSGIVEIADASIKTLSELIVGSGKSDTLIRIPAAEFQKVYKGRFESVAS
jgi:prolyl-tRNA synthetase